MERLYEERADTADVANFDAESEKIAAQGDYGHALKNEAVEAFEKQGFDNMQCVKLSENKNGN